MQLNTIQITFLNGATKTFASGITSLEIAHTISARLAQEALVALVNDQVWDLTRPIAEDACVKLLTWEDEAGKKAFWHSSAHLLAEALEALYPGVQLGIGPPIANGFYYDIDLGDYQLAASDLPIIEAKMLALARQAVTYQRIPISKEAAIKYYQQKANRYKLELLQDLQDGNITFYKQGKFIDLCQGPHIPHTGFIKAAKLLSIAGAYWRGNEKNKQLTRIYGISFPKQQELNAYLVAMEEAKKRSHQKLGKEQKLFMFSEKVGLGLPLWLPRGAILREGLEKFLRKVQASAGYQPVVTPHIGSKLLYVTSGHYEKYGQDAFQAIHTPHEGEEFLLKPMNCPHHCEIYNYEPRSYRDLPIRLAEFGTVYRYEQHGELHGISRTRGFTQDDAHIFCRDDQIKQEFGQVIDLVQYVFSALGFADYTVQISLRDPSQPEKYIGKLEAWDQAEQAIQQVVEEKGLPCVKVLGEAAFYGPKLDFMIKDALGRNWQLGTVQLDYQLPERFELTYTGPDNQKYRPVMIHRAPFGSLERVIAILLEHTAGKLPVWLVPEQVAILPISAPFEDYAYQVFQKLVSRNIRCFVDGRDEKIGKKIRDAELQKIPYMLVVGETEKENNTVAVRRQGLGDQGSMRVTDLIEQIERECI